MDINALIFESMIATASEKVEKLVESSVAVDDAVAQIADELELTNEEIQALSERAMKLNHKKVNADMAEAGDVIVDKDPEDCCYTNAIHFDSEDDLDQATGMLMYKNVPWKSKSKEGNAILIDFDDADRLKEAQSVLKRKYDFVESTPRCVGTVQFDNLGDYSKVLEFMKRQGMMIESQEGVSLDEDAEIQDALAIELGEETPPGRSFVARPRNPEAQADLNVFENSAARSVVVRKRWK